MADNGGHVDECNALETERKAERLSSGRVREQRTAKTKDKLGESHLPTPPPDPWITAGCFQGVSNQAEMTQPRSLDEEEDIIEYLTDLGTPPFESQTSECPSRNSATSTMAVAGLCTDEVFDHLDRLYALTEQILDLRNRSSRFFKRVRDLERLKVLRNADRRLENAFARDKDFVGNFYEEDTGFAESLLDAMLSNCRDPQLQRRNVRSPASRQRSTSLALSEQSLPRLSNPANRPELEKQTSRNESTTGAPKVSKWTRVKAAFKWERAYTNDVAESMESTTNTPSTPTTKYLRIPEAGTGNWSGSTVSSCTSEISGPPTPFGRVSSASSSNEGSYDGARKNASTPSDRQSVKTKEDRKKENSSRRSRSLDGDIITTDVIDVSERSCETSPGKPVIRITSDNNPAMHSSNATEKRRSEGTSKKTTPTLTITIPSNEEEVRSISSPESISPLLSSTQNSGGNSPQHAKTRQEQSREFKRQRSTMEEPTTPAPKIQRQDSKWNKVRRAFLTNSAFSVPPSPVRVMSGQLFLQDGSETPKAHSCTGSVEDLEKAATSSSQAETRRDYQALREKLGTEFHRKLVEWERLKNISPRAGVKTNRDVHLSNASSNPREGLLPEERLAPEFKKKLQDWKRAKKGRRGSATFEQQRVSRRRLTDWQLWRLPLKPETRNQDTIGSRGSCGSGGSAGSTVSDGRSHLCEDFVRRMEAWRRMNETGRETSKRSNLNRLGAASGIDESEFLALEKVLVNFGDRIGRERRESDARQLEECFDGDTRFVDGAQSVNCGNEVLIRTSVGSYRFEGISREFTRKLYDWEKYRGISPRSSTFRLLGPAYCPFTGETNIETSTEVTPTTKISDEEKVFFGILKRSKSVGSVYEGSPRQEPPLRRSTSLQSLDRLTKTLDDVDRIDTSPAPIDPRRTEDPSEDTAMEDSEPEAMIVDIEDVIEETASPLNRVQPHQTPVYSVAASETTSIAVPLGTVTSSHEPSPVFLVEVEDNPNRKHWESRTWNRRKNFSSEDSSSPEHFEVRNNWNKRKASCQDDVDHEGWRMSEPWRRKDYFTRSNFGRYGIEGWRRDDQLSREKNCNKLDDLGCSIQWNRRDDVEEKSEIRDRRYDSIESEEIPTVSSDGEDASENSTREREPDEKEESNTIRTTMERGSRSALSEDTKESMDISSEKGRESVSEDEKEDDDRTSADEEDTLEDEMKIDNEYEEITPGIAISYSSSSLENRPAVDYQGATNSLLNSKLRDSSNEHKAASIFFSTRKEESKRSHEENYGTIREELHSRQYHELSNVKSDLQDFDERNNSIDSCKGSTATSVDTTSNYNDNCIKGTLMFVNPTEKILKEEKQRYQNFGSISTSITRTLTSSSTVDYHREPTIPTTPFTVASCREDRCLERIIINEKTLNKIVVPTASASESNKSLSDPMDSARTKDSSEERNSNQEDFNREGSNRERNTKKNDSPTRSVFVKTKRMIFSPFRRSEDRARKESDTSEEDRTLRPKSKSKSRSSSPKVSRQDALLRMPLSLPWPLRPCSKDRDIKSEPKIDRLENKHERSTSERQDSTINKRMNIEKVSSNNNETLFGRNSALREYPEDREIPGSRIGRSSIDRERLKKSGQKEHQDISIQVTPSEEKRTPITIRSSYLKTKETETEVSSRTDPLSSDLIHKLNILSSVAARRDGRTNTISVDSSLESHSSKVRRAKENFLSRRGGPLCHSVLEPRTVVALSSDLLRVRSDRCEKVSESEEERLAKREERTKDKSEDKKLTNEARDVSIAEEDEAARKEEDSSTRDEGTNDSESIAASRPDLVKSASVGMINVDPDTFERLADANRGCESLPRTISKRRESSGPFAKIVNKFKLSRLIRGKDSMEGDMSTISRLCRQSLLIDVRSEFDEQREGEGGNLRDQLPRMDRNDDV